MYAVNEKWNSTLMVCVSVVNFGDAVGDAITE
jgi:hypothetical protein